MSEPSPLTIKLAAAEAGVCRKTVRGWIATKELKALRLIGRGTREFFRIERPEWERFLKRKRA